MPERGSYSADYSKGYDRRTGEDDYLNKVNLN